MARQLGPIYIKGTLDDLTFYEMDGEHYVRMKSRLSKKKVLTCPRFVLTRMHASQLAEASRIASIIYRQLPKEERNIKLFRSIVGKAKILLWTGKEREEVREELECLFIHEGLEYRTRNNQLLNVRVNDERVKVKGESIVRQETSDLKNERSKVKCERKGFRKSCKVRMATHMIETSDLLLVNEAGRLMEKLYKSVSALNYMVLDPSLRSG